MRITPRLELLTEVRILRRLVVAWLVVLGVPASVRSQVGASADLVVGRVTGPDDAPLAGAYVEVVSAMTGVVRRATTRSDGWFTVLFRDGGGQYHVAVKFIGMQPVNVVVSRQSDEDRLVVNVRMSRAAQQLASVEVRSSRSRPTAVTSTATPGGAGKTFPATTLQRVPVSPGDLEAVAALTAGATPIPASDTGRATFSVAAQPASQNQTSVDGASFLFGTMPQDAIRSVTVVTSTYDVSRAQFLGGMTITSTKAGTELFQGTATYSARARSLQFADAAASTFARRYVQQIVSGGAGGPLGGSGRAFYFVAGQFERRADDVFSLGAAPPRVLQKLGVDPDSVVRFLGTTARIAGPIAPSLDHVTTNGSASARLDFDVTDSKTLFWRGDFRHIGQTGARVPTLALPSAGARTRADGGAMTLGSTSVFGPTINDTRLTLSRDWQSAIPNVRVPYGVVTVGSRLDDGTQVATLQFGGNPRLPADSRVTLVEVTDEVSRLSENGAHRAKLGLLFHHEDVAARVVANEYGTFFFNSLSGFDAGVPSAFVRQRGSDSRPAGSDNAGIYAGDAWRPGPSLQITYGARIEGTRIDGSLGDNPAVTRAFGRRSNVRPLDVQVSPRFGFTYLIGNVAGAPEGVLRGGFGEFRGKVPNQLAGAVVNGSGLAGGPMQLICVGSATPTPNWTAYALDTLAIPAACTTTSSNVGTAPTVAMFDRAFGPPRARRASLDVARRIFDRFSVSLAWMMVDGRRIPSTSDLNLRATPFASIANEGHRPLYVPPSAIVPTSGAAAFSASRLVPEFGAASLIESTLRSRATQVTAQLSSPIGLATIQTSYTYMRARDQSNGFSFVGTAPTTSGDPRNVEWGPSDLERRHGFALVVVLPLPHSLELSVIGRASSGALYTPMVNGDVNGDGLRNDRAFVFSPDAQNTDTAVANGMRRLLARSNTSTRRCLNDQLNQIAIRNRCASPWSGSLDLQINVRPERLRLDRRLTISIVAANALTGLDFLAHGRNRLRGWGQSAATDPVLLNVLGFDPAAGRWRYQVNEHFGAATGASSALRTPFQLGFQVHVSLGTDAQRAMLKSIYGTEARGRTDPDAIKARIIGQFPNPVRWTLAVADSLVLGLDSAQRARLEALDRLVAERADSLVGGIARVLARAGSNPDLGVIGGHVQRMQIAELHVVQQAVLDLRDVLTPAQWDRLPDRIKYPLAVPSPTANPR